MRAVSLYAMIIANRGDRRCDPFDEWHADRHVDGGFQVARGRL